MSSSKRRKQNRDRMQAHRDRLRRQGLGPIQIWVPDTRSPEFAEEARRQSLAIAKSAQAEEDQRFVEAITDPDVM